MQIAEVKAKVTPILKAHGVTSASLFGSVARGDDKPESDVDILVELGRPMGLFGYMRLARELEQILGRKVDLVTKKSLNKFIRPHVLPELRPLL